MENNNQSDQIKSEDNFSMPVDPNINTSLAGGLKERIDEQNSKVHHPKGRTKLFIFIVVLFVLIGVGGWWYYAQGQAWMIVKQAKWDWGLENLENYQQDTNLSFEISTRNNGEQDIYSMFFSDNKINLDISSKQKNVGLDLESDLNLLAKTEGLNLDVGFKVKKIGDKFYLSIDTGSMEDLFGGMIPIPDFGDTWFEMDVKDSYSLSLDKDKLAKVNIRFNNFLDNLRNEKVFDIKDLKKNQDGFRKIQLNIKEDKIEIFALLGINYGADVYEIISDVDKDSLDYKDYRVKNIESFKKMKSEKPDEWFKFLEIFKAIDFMILIDEGTKSIHGLEIYLNNMIIDSGTSSTIVNGNIKYYIKTIEPYNISKPMNIKKIEGWEGIYETAMDEPKSEEEMIAKLKETDTDQDGLNDYLESLYGTSLFNPDSDGDGYTDGEEVDNGYNPMGEGELSDIYVEDWGVVEDVDLGSTAENDYNAICSDSGGEWTLAEKAEETVCSTILEEDYDSVFGAWDDCDAISGCSWGFSECKVSKDYCLCPDGNKKEPFDSGIFFPCD